MISKEQVKYIAKLARLGLDEEQIEKMQGGLASILDYVDKLQQVDTSEVEVQLSYAKRMREDEVRPSETADKLKDLAPDRESDYFKVKSILDQ